MKTTKKKPRRRVRPRPMDLRYETQRQWIARLLLLGWTAEQIARHVGRTPRAIRYAISTPEFQTLYAQLQSRLMINVAGGVMMRRCGPDLMSVLRPRPTSDRSGFVEHDVSLIVHMRNVLDNNDTTPMRS